MKFDMITFGSATYDVFLTSDEFTLQKRHGKAMLCEMYGSKVDIDKYVATTGGGATNVAVGFERLGLQTAVVACVGHDYWGRIIKATLVGEGVSLLHLQTTAKKPTSSSVVLVGKDGGRTVLAYRAASNDLSWYNVDWQRLDAKWLYISSLGGDFAMLTKIIRLSREKDIKIAFNPGNLELEYPDKLRSLLRYVEVLLVNKQEAQKLLGKKEVSGHGFVRLGSRYTVVTNGRFGTTLYCLDGQIYKQPIVKVKTVEETGAGDAFGTGFVSGQAHGLPLEKSLLLGAYNAAGVVEHIGPKAGLLFWPEARKKINV